MREKLSHTIPLNEFPHKRHMNTSINTTHKSLGSPPIC